MAQSNPQKLGQLGEDQAAEFLVKIGYELLARNVRSLLGEIDLLMKDGEEIVLVEVKTQTSGVWQDPLEQIGPAKQVKLRLLLREVAAHYPDQDVRVDAVRLYWSGEPKELSITHLENILD